mmetsp:Transcript_15604/g.17346  ORF Transcript_15604/g.17346 Transcript_15604/m.17346 type:complete len:631 (+) Transcript_15604:56-1948(+)
MKEESASLNKAPLRVDHSSLSGDYNLKTSIYDQSRGKNRSETIDSILEKNYSWNQKIHRVDSVYIPSQKTKGKHGAGHHHSYRRKEPVLNSTGSSQRLADEVMSTKMLKMKQSQYSNQKNYLERVDSDHYAAVKRARWKLKPQNSISKDDSPVREGNGLSSFMAALIHKREEKPKMKSKGTYRSKLEKKLGSNSSAPSLHGKISPTNLKGPTGSVARVHTANMKKTHGDLKSYEKTRDQLKTIEGKLQEKVDRMGDLALDVLYERNLTLQQQRNREKYARADLDQMVKTRDDIMDHHNSQLEMLNHLYDRYEESQKEVKAHSFHKKREKSILKAINQFHQYTHISHSMSPQLIASMGPSLKESLDILETLNRKSLSSTTSPRGGGVGGDEDSPISKQIRLKEKKHHKTHSLLGSVTKGNHERYGSGGSNAGVGVVGGGGKDGSGNLSERAYIGLNDPKSKVRVVGVRGSGVNFGNVQQQRRQTRKRLTLWGTRPRTEVDDVLDGASGNILASKVMGTNSESIMKKEFEVFSQFETRTMKNTGKKISIPDLGRRDDMAYQKTVGYRMNGESIDNLGAYLNTNSDIDVLVRELRSNIDRSTLKPSKELSTTQKLENWKSEFYSAHKEFNDSP